MARCPKGSQSGRQRSRSSCAVASPWGQRTVIPSRWSVFPIPPVTARASIFTGVREGQGKPDQRFPIERGEDNTAHWRNLIECAQHGRKDTWSPMDLAFRTQTVLQMAALGAKQGKVAHFDAQQRQILL